MDPATMMMLANAAMQVGKQFQGDGGGGGDKYGGMQKVPTKNKQQMGFLNQQLNDLSKGQLGKGYKSSIDLLTQMLNPESELYKNFEQPYMQQFHEQTIPGLSEQFAGVGGTGMSGALQSSGFGQSLGAAGGQLQSSLAQMKNQMMMNAMQSLLGQYNQQGSQAMGVDPYAYTDKNQGMFANMLPGLSKGGMDFLSNKFMNPSGGGGGAPTVNPLTSQLDTLFRSGAAY